MSSTIVKEKSNLRKQINDRLLSLTAPERKVQSAIIHQKVVSSEVFKKSQRISIFLSLEEEVNTYPIVQSILDAGKSCFIPHCDEDVMIMVPFNSWETYKTFVPNSWGIMEPQVFDPSLDATQSGGLDLMFMPGLGFTKKGERLGRGKGYYDKYLVKCSETGTPPETIALIFKEQLLDHIPTAEHDMLIDHLFYPTDEEVAEYSKKMSE